MTGTTETDKIVREALGSKGVRLFCLEAVLVANLLLTIQYLSQSPLVLSLDEGLSFPRTLQEDSCGSNADRLSYCPPSGNRHMVLCEYNHLRLRLSLNIWMKQTSLVSYVPRAISPPALTLNSSSTSFLLPAVTYT